MDLFISKKELNSLRKLNIRQIITQLVLAAFSIVQGYTFWKFIGVILDNDSPVVVVLSASMEPGFKRGDILFLKPATYKVGSTCVFQTQKNTIPIVHRVIKNFNGKILTKGDNNPIDDMGLYTHGLPYLTEKETRSSVIGYIPFFGQPTLWVSSIPALKMICMFLPAILLFIKR